MLVDVTYQLSNDVIASDPLIDHRHMNGLVGSRVGQPRRVVGKSHGDFRVGEQAHHDLGPNILQSCCWVGPDYREGRGVEKSARAGRRYPVYPARHLIPRRPHLHPATLVAG